MDSDFHAWIQTEISNETFRNRHHFAELYEKGNNLFEKLRTFRDAWRPFVALGCVNLDDLSEIHLKDCEDWNINFKACKHFSQQIAKISSTEHRIDCFVINTSPLRSDIEFISRKYWEVLTYSLRSSIIKDITTLQDFLNQAWHALQSVPQMEEQYIEDAGANYERIISELPNVNMIANQKNVWSNENSFRCQSC